MAPTRLPAQGGRSEASETQLVASMGLKGCSSIGAGAYARALTDGAAEVVLEALRPGEAAGPPDPEVKRGKEGSEAALREGRADVCQVLTEGGKRRVQTVRGVSVHSSGDPKVHLSLSGAYSSAQMTNLGKSQILPLRKPAEDCARASWRTRTGAIARAHTGDSTRIPTPPSEGRPDVRRRIPSAAAAAARSAAVRSRVSAVDFTAAATAPAAEFTAAGSGQAASAARACDEVEHAGRPVFLRRHPPPAIIGGSERVGGQRGRQDQAVFRFAWRAVCVWTVCVCARACARV
jgi:hypothetical protein